MRDMGAHAQRATCDSLRVDEPGMQWRHTWEDVLSQWRSMTVGRCVSWRTDSIRKVVGLFFVRGVELSRGVVGVDVEAKLYGTGQKVEHQRAIRLLADGAWQVEPSGSFSAGVGVCCDMIVPVFAPRPPDLVDDEVSEGEL